MTDKDNGLTWVAAIRHSSGDIDIENYTPYLQTDWLAQLS